MLQGGVAAGLSHVVEDTTPKLFLVKGKRQPIVRQTPALSWSAMNDGDVFVLDAREFIFVWVGRQSNRLERLQAAKVRLSFSANEVYMIYGHYPRKGFPNSSHALDSSHTSQKQASSLGLESHLRLESRYCTQVLLMFSHFWHAKHMYKINT